MAFQVTLPYAYSPNIWPAVIASVLMFALAIYSFRHRAMPGALPFAIACTFGLLWTLGSILEYTALDFALKIFWRKFQVLFQLPSATAITCFLLEYAWPKRFLTSRNLLVLWAVPVAAIIVIVTNDVHLLFWEDFITNGQLVPVAGPFMPFFLAYIFVNFAINLTIFTWLFIHSPQNRWPVVIMATGQIFMRALYFVDIGDHTSVNLSYASIGIAITSLMYAVVFFRFQILGPIPLARQAVPDQLPIGMLVLDDQERIHSLNPAAEQMLQIQNKATKGLNIRQVLPVLPQDAVSKNRGDPIEFSLAHLDGARVYTLSVSSLEDWRAQPVGQLLLITDVTAQRKAQAKILEQGRALAILEEREQISRELHDDLAQVLAFINTQSQAIQRLLSRGDLETSQSLVLRMIEAVQASERDLRQTIHGIRLRLSEHGLLETLEAYRHQFTADTAIKVDLITSDSFDITLLNPMQEVQLLRILQEALTNSRKHSQATRIRLNFEVIDSTVCVTVADNGRGFEINKQDLAPNHHFGLQMMRERAQSVGGTIHLDSTPGKGTHIKVCLPVEKKMTGG